MKLVYWSTGTIGIVAFFPVWVPIKVPRKRGDESASARRLIIVENKDTLFSSGLRTV